ncbi:MAG: hypothetical protein ACMV1D_01380 [Macromonas sp.]
MNLPHLLTTFEKIDPAGFQQANASLTSLAMSAGAELTLAQVQHVTANIKNLPAFLGTPQGRKAVKAFVEAWQASE